MTIPLADLKAIAARYDSTVKVSASPVVPRGQMVVVNAELLGMGDVAPGRLLIAVHPDDFRNAGYAGESDDG